MELASRVFDVVTKQENVTDPVRKLLKQLSSQDELRYWRRVLRMAALCHDVGHLPYSHAAEKELLPNDWDHERLTRQIVSSEEMKDIWGSITPPLRHQDIEKLAVGPKNAENLEFADWEAILAEIIVGDAFGVDRMDYLLRDSHHSGVAYGKFDHYRLIDTLRILPQSDEKESSQEPVLGVEEGGIHSAEALMLARYFMYTQVYFHPVRRKYDIHLRDFLREWLDDGVFSTDLESHLRMTDNEVAVALRQAADSQANAGHFHARRILGREHFKRLYEWNPEDVKTNPESGKAVLNALSKKYREDFFRHDSYSQENSELEFPIRMRDNRIVSSLSSSGVLKTLPVVWVDCVFADRSIYDDANKWLMENRHNILKPEREEAGDG